MAEKYWLMKSEPEVYGIDHLARDKKGHWDGVRNFTARNNMKQMKIGDRVLFYHSSTDPIGVAGVARVCREAYPDFTQWDKKSDYYEPKATKEKPYWYMVDVEFVEKFPHFVSMDEIKGQPELEDMVLLKRGRLSVQPVAKKQFEIICRLGESSFRPVTSSR